MDETQAKALGDLSELANKIALELVFAEPGTDSGLLPVNSFLCEMEELAGRFAVCSEAVDAIAKAREVIDDIFLSDALFTAKSLEALNAWAPWFQSAMKALVSGQSLEPVQEAAPRALLLPELTPSPALNSAPTPAAEIVLTPSASSLKSEPEPSSAALILNLPDDRELLAEFINESREHLQNIETGVLTLEESPADKETLNSIFRAFHTFKGGSGFLNLAPINKLAHELESLLEQARQHKIKITSRVIEIILAGGDTLKRFVDAMDLQVSGAVPVAPIVIPTTEIHERIARFLSSSEEPAASSEKVPAESQTEYIQRPTERNPMGKAVPPAMVKVDTCKLDSLIDMVGEMVIAQSLVSQDSELKSISSQRLARNLALLATATRELQRTAMSLRMVPIRNTFQKMTRLVRDLSMWSGKPVELVLSGEECELDRTIVEEIGDPLIHLIRNAVDHGIEKPEVRAAAGKPAVGTIHLSAFHHGGSFVVQLRDDGGGLNCEKILRKAIAQGIVAPDADLSEKEIFALIFAPGFSTAEALTDISGRGVGMDVVRGNIEKLRGKIEIESTLGEGATFSMHLPLTLAIIDGLIVRTDEERYIIPTLSVRESIRPAASMLSTVTGRGEIVNVRGNLLPLLRLRTWLTGVPDTSDPTQGVIVVVEGEGVARGVLVDELIGKQEVVIKSLGETFQNNSMLAGAAILGDGRVGLILDVNALAHARLPQLSKAA